MENANLPALFTTSPTQFYTDILIAKSHDPETGGHILRTQHYIKALSAHLYNHPKYHQHFTSISIDDLSKSAIFHDIGKLQLPSALLMKTEQLEPQEFEEIKTHTTKGHELIKRIRQHIGTSPFLRVAADVAEYHHEKWDGTGYPHGLQGNSIPLSARIMALADVYDAIISPRAYKEAQPHSVAVEYIHNQRGKHFDPIVVDAFTFLEKSFLSISTRLQTTAMAEKHGSA